MGETVATTKTSDTAKPVARPHSATPSGLPTLAGAGERIVGLWRRIPLWMRRWDFALALAVGALLRLLWLGDTSFLGDQADLLALGRSALAHHTLLATGIRSSIGAMNPPAAVQLLLPFASLNDPYWAALATALANVVAVALLYGVANRYLGRRAAFAATLLYATASGPIAYSRFIWQQNLLAPVLLLFFWTLCLGVIDHKRGWLGWNVLLWAVAIQLHPTALPLIGLTLLGAYLVRAEVRPRDLAWVVGALALLFAPTLAWELASQGLDVTAALGYGHNQSVVDTSAGHYLYALFLPASDQTHGSAALHSVVAPGLGWLYIALGLVYLGAQVWLAASVVGGVLTRGQPRGRRARGGLAGRLSAAMRPVVRPANEFAPEGLAATTPADADSRADDATAPLLARSRAATHAALARPEWRFLLFLALWQALPVLAMIRHSSPVQPHYLLVVLPATFLVVGAFLAWAARWLAIWASRGWARVRRASGPTAPTSSWIGRAGYALALVVILLAAAQTYGVWTQLNAIHTGAVDTTASNYGMTLTQQRRVLQAAATAASEYHTQATIATTSLLQDPLDYQAAIGYSGVSAYIGAGCLVAPSAGGAPLVALATPSVGAADLLGQLRGARLLGAVSTPGAASIPMYLLPGAARFPGETTIIAPTATTPVGAPDAAPVAYAMDASGSAGTQLIIRWSGAPLATGAGQPATGPYASALYWYGALAGGPVVANYNFFAQPFDAAGHALDTPLRATCGGLAWGHGADVYSAVTLPTTVETGQIARWRVWAQAAPLTVSRPTLGPLTLESGALTFGPYITVAQPTEFAVR